MYIFFMSVLDFHVDISAQQAIVQHNGVSPETKPAIPQHSPIKGVEGAHMADSVADVRTVHVTVPAKTHHMTGGTILATHESPTTITPAQMAAFTGVTIKTEEPDSDSARATSLKGYYESFARELAMSAGHLPSQEQRLVVLKIASNLPIQKNRMIKPKTTAASSKPRCIVAKTTLANDLPQDLTTSRVTVRTVQATDLSVKAKTDVAKEKSSSSTKDNIKDSSKLNAKDSAKDGSELQNKEPISEAKEKSPKPQGTSVYVIDCLDEVKDYSLKPKNKKIDESTK